MQCKRRSQEEWMELIQICRNSGLSDRAWCIQEGISPNTFYSAIKSLRKKSCDIPAPVLTRMPETHEIVRISILIFQHLHRLQKRIPIYMDQEI